jgi:hypothetical protein
VYVRDDYGGLDSEAFKWKISMTPMVFSVSLLEAHKVKVVYPLINLNERDAYWEMIIGHDCQQQWEVINACSLANVRAKCDLTATPGPAFTPGTWFMGHNVALVNLRDRSSPPDEFFEYLCFDSATISRLAVNKVACKMVVEYRDGPTVHQFDLVPGPVFRMLETGASKEEVVGIARNACQSSVLKKFPDAMLTDVDHVQPLQDINDM